MRFILFLILLVGLIFMGLTILDYFGYYIDWKDSILSVSILVPVVTAIRNMISKPFKKLKKIHTNIDNN